MADDQQDWRLRIALGPGHGLEEAVRSVQRPGVVVTHDGRTLFAYAPSDAAARAVRDAIAGALPAAQIVESHWDADVDDWIQVNPPLRGEDARREGEAVADAETLVTQTFACQAGNLSRAAFEQTMAAQAQQLGVECGVLEHHHLLSTQIAFTVSGPRRKVEEFREGLDAIGSASVRAEFNAFNPG
jgi:hypothetical protein